MNFTPTAPPTVDKKQEEDTLTTEARDAMGALADLGFMQATVLMFPYKDYGD